MDHRKTIVFKKQDIKDAAGKVTKEIPVRDLPDELSKLFIEDVKWKPLGNICSGSRKFVANEFAQKVMELNDCRPHLPTQGQDSVAAWQVELTNLLSSVDVGVEWEDA